MMEKSNGSSSYQQAQSSDRFVYLVTRDYNFASYISQQITHFGYHVQHARDIKSLANAIADHRSIALLMDIPAGEGLNDHAGIFGEISKLQSASLAIFLSPSSTTRNYG